jgi:hypothetical protein
MPTQNIIIYHNVHNGVGTWPKGWTRKIFANILPIISFRILLTPCTNHDQPVSIANKMVVFSLHSASLPHSFMVFLYVFQLCCSQLQFMQICDCN